MPMTALLSSGMVVDATTADDADEGRWSMVYRNREVRLSCPGCSGRVVAKQMHATGLRFFAHRSQGAGCYLGGETMAHRLLKLELATACRAAGWHAALEVRSDSGLGRATGSRTGCAPDDGDDDERPWRADVLATSPAGQRWAFEAQLAGISVPDVMARHEAMARDGVSAVWVTGSLSSWFGRVPSLRVELLDAKATWPDARPAPGGWVALRVTAGLAGFMNRRWEAFNSVEPLAAVVAKVLDERLGWHHPDPAISDIALLPGQRGHGGFFTTAGAIKLQAAYLEHLVHLEQLEAAAGVPPPRAPTPRAAAATSSGLGRARQDDGSAVERVRWGRRDERTGAPRRERTAEQTALLPAALSYV